MKIYYSNAQAENWDKIDIKPFPFLVSYYELAKQKKEYKRQKKCSNLMLDSGAFSAWRQNKEIKVEDYIEFLLNTKSKFDHIISLDIFGDDSLSCKNYLKMKKAGLNVIPVFHADAELKYLYKYVDETNYIGLGGFAKSYKKNRLISMKRVFDLFPDSNKVGFHGFGVNDIELMKIFPWKSVDASTAHICARYGIILTPWGAKTIIKAGDIKRHKWKSEIKEKIVNDYLKSINCDFTKIFETTVPGKVERCRCNIVYLESIKDSFPTKYETKINYLF